MRRSLASFRSGWRFCDVALATLLAVAGVARCYSQAPPDTSDLEKRISGTVVNKFTNEPIGRALVYTNDQQSAAITDDRGHFELTLAESPSQTDGHTTSEPWVVLEAKKQGFLTPAHWQGMEVDLRERKDVTISLIPEGLIIGNVKFPSAEAGDQVQARLYRREVREGSAQWAPVNDVPTRADGEFRFAELRPGAYKLFTREALERDPLTSTATGPVFGFPPRYFANSKDFAAADTINIRAGETVEANITLVRERYYNVNIPVLGGELVDAGIDVSVHAQGRRGPGFELGYDPEQHAIRGSLPNGTYAVEASTAGPTAASGVSNISVVNGAVSAPALTLAANPSVAIIVRQELIRGEDSMQQASVYVSLHPAEEVSTGQWGGATYQGSSSDGMLPTVKPGRYWVQANAQSSDMYIASMSSGGKDLMRTPLVVPSGASVPAIDILVRNDIGAQINVTFEGSTTQQLPLGRGAIVRLQSGRLNGIHRPRVYCIAIGGGTQPLEFFPAQQSFVLSNVPPGDYRIVAFDDPQEFEYRNPEAMAAYDSMGRVVRVSAGQELQVQLAPPRSR
jgi:hypothetical protein